MASRDTALFSAPRTLHFDLLISDEESSDGENTPTNTIVPTQEQNDASKAASASGATVEASVVEDVNGEDDWSCAKPKPHRKSSGGRNVGFTKGNGNFSASKKPIVPVLLEQLSPKLTLEIYDFPESWRTNDIKKILSPLDGKYRLKWQNDTSCFIHFETAEEATNALAELQPKNAFIRPFAPENVLPATAKPDISQMSAENTMEVFSFPPSWHSNELNKLLAAFAGQYRLKWRNYASCYVVFDSADMMQKAFAEISRETVCKARPYAPGASSEVLEPINV